MKNTVSLYDFREAFRQYDRQNTFSYEGYQALFDELEQYEEDCNQEIELDIVALCCEYTEYKNLKELQGNYWDIKSMEDLRDHTIVIEIPDTDRFIIQNY